MPCGRCGSSRHCLQHEWRHWPALACVTNTFVSAPLLGSIVEEDHILLDRRAGDVEPIGRKLRVGVADGETAQYR